MSKPIYVTGHKNPDSDSICAAIAYSNFKNNLGMNTIPSRLGELNNESKYILNKFGFSAPLRIFSAKCTLAEIEKDEAILIRKTDTMKETLDAITKRKNKGAFVIDDHNKLEGVVSMSNLTGVWIADEDRLTELMKSATLDNILKTIQGELLFEAEFKPNGKVHLLPSLGQNSQIEPGTIVICGNYPDVQRSMIEQNAGLIIICGENWVDSVTMMIADTKKVPIIHTPLSAIAIAKLIYQSLSVEQVMTKNVVTFKNSETVDGASTRMAKTRFRTYPVLNDKEEVVGAISRYHLFNYEKKKFILVDHNEATQSVNDLEFGEVMEIVDHHRLGGIMTSTPIQFINKIVGSTCTIVYELYKQYKMELPQNYAGLLLAGILSDTMSLKSPTTKESDILAVEELAEICHIDVNELSQELIQTADSLFNKTFEELLFEDFKEFNVGDVKVAVGQTACRSSSEYQKIKKDFVKYMEEENKRLRCDLLMMVFTKTNGEGSYFLYTGEKSWVVEEGFKPAMLDDFAPHFISRKQQVLPVILETLNQ